MSSVKDRNISYAIVFAIEKNRRLSSMPVFTRSYGRGGRLLLRLGEGRFFTDRNGIWRKVWHIMMFKDGWITNLYDLLRIDVQILLEPLVRYLAGRSSYYLCFDSITMEIFILVKVLCTDGMTTTWRSTPPPLSPRRADPWISKTFNISCTIVIILLL